MCCGGTPRASSCGSTFSTWLCKNQRENIEMRMTHGLSRVVNEPIVSWLALAFSTWLSKHQRKTLKCGIDLDSMDKWPRLARVGVYFEDCNKDLPIW